MNETSPTSSDANAEPIPPGEAGTPTTSATWGEFWAVLAVGVVPNLLGAFASLHQPGIQDSYWMDFLLLIATSACTIYVTLYLISRSGDSWNHFGLGRPELSDCFLGVAMFLVAIAVLCGFYKTMFLFDDDTAKSNFPSPTTSFDYAMMIVKFLIAAFSEELVTRAYLITRLESLLRSHWKALVISAFLFASYHVYQGASGVYFSLLFGLAYGFAYLGIRRIWPLVLGHAGYNVLVDLLNAAK